MSKYITTVQELIDVLNQVKDKTRPIKIQGILCVDENCRNEYQYFYEAEIWDNIDRNKNDIITTLVLS